MEQTSIDGNETKVQIIESTCLLNKKLNRNNAIDGTNIVYLAGASIVFHNIFQNTKRFISRISDNEVIGMAFFKSSQNMVALGTKSKNKTSPQEITQNQSSDQRSLKIELYTLGQEGSILAQLNDSAELIDMQFVQKKRVILLVRQLNEHYFYFLQPKRKMKKIQVNMEKPRKFISQDRRISVIGQQGMKDLDIEMENLTAQLKFPHLSVDDYALIDNEFEVILSNGQLYCYHEYELTHSIFLSDFQQSLTLKIEPSCLVHVGRNLLIAHKNSITLSHFIVDNGMLKFLNHYTYKQKIKGGIISMEVSFDEMHLAMAVELIERDVTKIENFMFNLSILSSQKKFISPFIRLFPLGTENAEITSLHGVIPFDTYYLAGNSIVNYSFNDTVEKKFKFGLHQVPKLLCAHPLGYQFACLFETQVKFYIKIENEIVEVWNEQLICSTAKYMTCGHLLLASFEDGFYQLVMYDTNAFVKVKNIPNILVKHPVTGIQLIEQDSQVVLYIGHDMGVYTLKTGQKIAEFKEKKDKQQILALVYDPNLMVLLTSTANQQLTYSKKIDDNSWEFKYQKVISLKEEVTFIEINTLLQTVFMGTKSGKLLWTQYPLNLIERQDLKYTIQYREIKLSQNPVSKIHITNNFKYLFISFKNEGLVICKLKKIIKYQGNARYSQFEISNLNFIQTSSKNCLESGQQKLKFLLEKRKTVFNDLDQYKKQWEINKNKTIKVLNTQNKHKQLTHINQALGQVERIKKEKEACYQQLRIIDHETSAFIKQKQEKYQKQIMLFYDKNIDLKVKRQKVLKRCEEEFSTIQKKCKENIDDIEHQLKKKYTVFMQNYSQMKNNLSLFEKRFEIQNQQAQQILLQLFAEKRQKLQIEENSQNKRSNELKALITKHKKQLQRFNSRKYFLEQKKNYFVEQVNFCTKEKGDLIEVKDQLEMELSQLEVFTNKKQKRLRRYFKENQILTKYQLIHNNLMANLDHEVEFMQGQKDGTSKNIISVQKELSEVAQLNETYQGKIEKLKREIKKSGDRTYSNAEKTRYLQHLIEEMSESLQKMKSSLNDQNKADLFGQVYRQFFIERKLQKIIQSTNVVDTTEQEQQMQYRIFNSAQNKKKVLQNLQKHKTYLQKNMMLFQKHNKKTDQQMNLNHLKHQTQNYNLIAECNIRKEQTNKKKRILHQLIDSVKETQLYMNELQKENFDQLKLYKSTSSNHRSTDSIPFIQYKKNKEDEEKSRVKVLRRESSEPTLWKVRQSTYQVRKMLDIQKITRPGSQNKVERRIKTAMIKNRNTDNTIHVQSSEFIPVNSDSSSHLKKPMTATGKRHQAPFGQYYTYSGVKNKSASKPTTCTTHTNKNKFSLYQ